MHRGRTLTASLLLVGVVLGTRATALSASYQTNEAHSNCQAAKHRLPAGPNSVAFAFGVGGLHPYQIKILRDGTIINNGDTQAPVKSQIDPGALPAILTLATALGFFQLPRVISGQVTHVDAPPTYISVFTRTGQKTVLETPTGYSRAYTQLAAVLDTMVLALR